MANIDLATITTGDGSQGFVLQGELALDLSGTSVASAGDVNGDGFDDLIVGARQADGPADGRNLAGDSYVIFGKASGFTATIDLAAITAGNGSQGFVLQGELADDRSGVSVASAGDVNGDGFDDLVVGAFFADGPADGRSYAGDSYVIFGKAGGFAATIDLAAITAGNGSQGFVLQGERANDNSGWSVASAGDVNGDGFDDLIVGAPRADGPADGRLQAGDSYVVFGKAGGFAATIDLAAITAGNGSQGFVLQGELAGDYSGLSVASAGDVNGDGFDDLIVGARTADGPADGRNGAGDSYVIFGKASGFAATIDLAAITTGNGSQGFVLQGELASDLSGLSVASAGDVNGDGFDDLIVGANLADGPADGRNQAGDSYVIFGKASGFAATIDLAAITAGDGSQGFVLQGELADDFSGVSVASAGDVNGDGFDDLIVGANGADGPADGRSFAGDSYVIFGKASGFAATIDLAAITAGDGSQGFVLHGELTNDQSGNSVASAGDVNGDGFDDLIVGASNAGGPADGRSGAGDSYVIFGSATIGGSVNHVTHAGDATSQTLTGTAGADDMVGGRGNDILLGQGGADVLIGGEGNDTLTVGSASFARVSGGTGSDTLAFSGAITLVDTHFRKVEGIESFKLGNGATSLTLGLNAAHAIDGLASNAFQIAIDGSLVTNAAVTIDGSALTRGMSINLGNDTVAVSLTGGSGNDVFTGGSGNDTLSGGAGADTLNGGAGTSDTASYVSSSVGVTVNVATNVNIGGDAAGDSLSGIENLTGSGQADTLTGDGNANILDGGGGNDTLTGGGGDDTIVGGGGNDTIDGGTGIDRAVFSGLRSAYTLTALSGNGVQVVGPDGTDTLSNIENLVFDDRTIIWPAINGGLHGDFDGNGRADILFRHADGSIALWQTNAAGQLSSAQLLGSAPAAYRIDAIGDFNGNGRDDILFRHDNGGIASWQTDANGQLVSANLLGSTATAWQVDGIGDFDGNGRDDILFRNSNGAIAVWQTNAAGQLVSAQEIGSAANAWHVVGIGDFDGNGRSDILFRNDNGSIAAWQTDANGQLVSAQTLGSTGTEWHVSGIGDFDGNGRSDILFRNNDNAIAVWQTDAAGQLSSAAQIGTTSSAWHINGTGDFNGDSRTDILFRNDDGSIASWQTNAAPQVLGTVAPAWTISVHEFDFV